MDKLYELSESTSDGIPERLAIIVSRLPNQTNAEDLFLGLVFTLAVETGFQVPGNENVYDWFAGQLARMSFHRWVSAERGNITTEFIQTQSGLMAIVTGVVQRFNQSCCLKVSEFVPLPENECVPLKFSKLCELSVQLRTIFWLCRIETKVDSYYPEKAALENLPEHVLEKIATYLPTQDDKRLIKR